MLLDWLHGDLHHWAIFCCTVATLGLVGAAFASVGICFGKGALGFLNGSGRQPTVIVVNGSGQYVQQPQKRTWGLGRTYALFAAIFSGGPMLTLLIMGANHAAWVVVDWIGDNPWALALPALLFLVVGASWWLIGHDRKRERDERAELHALPTFVQSGPDELNVTTWEAAPIWSAPVLDQNWSEG